jgi:formate hydrogenlyase subunit 6/NADH:ubiquinone oxidoreductase subunit I
MPSIGQIIGLAEALRTPAVAICAKHCTHRHHQASTCSRCVQVCPTHAISVSADGPQLDALGCIDCGACASVCPTGALEPLKPTDPALLQMIATSAACTNRVTIACAQVSSLGSDIVTLHCLARLDRSLLLFAFARGAVSVRLCAGACDDCVKGHLVAQVSSVVADARRVLELFAVPGRIDFGEALEIPESEATPPVGLTRRGLFEILRKGGRDYAAKAVTVFLPEPGAKQEKSRRENPGQVPLKRELLLASLRALVPEGSAPPGARSPFMAPQLDRTRCNGCAMCGRICPSGALGIEEDGDGGLLRITCQEGTCVECGLCVEMCERKALSLAPVPTERILVRDLSTRMLIERRQHEAEPLYVSLEDKMNKLLGVAVHRI